MLELAVFDYESMESNRLVAKTTIELPLATDNASWQVVLRWHAV
jgi:hypothetical protein